jgi:hypothetical protein
MHDIRKAVDSRFSHSILRVCARMRNGNKSLSGVSRPMRLFHWLRLVIIDKTKDSEHDDRTEQAIFIS